MINVEVTCPACQSHEMKSVESVEIDKLAAAWARESVHGDGTTSETIRNYILQDVGASRIEFWRCGVCSLEVAQPMRSWSASHYPVEQHSLGFDHQVALAELARLSPKKVLDIGCADGQFLERGAVLGHHMTGIDFAEEDVADAQRRGLNAYVADVEDLRRIFAGQLEFDIITLFQIIEHLNEPDKIFNQINTIVARDARLIVGCPSNLRYTRNYAHRQRVSRSDFWDYPPQHTMRWTPQALTTFLARHKWKVVEVIYEPLNVVGATAHIATLNDFDLQPNAWVRRARTVNLMARMVSSKFFKRHTGIRLLVKAQRANSTAPAL